MLWERQDRVEHWTRTHLPPPLKMYLVHPGVAVQIRIVERMEVIQHSEKTSWT